MFARVRRRLKNWSRDERGSVLPMIAGSMFMLMGIGGLAIDGGRFFMLRSHLQSAVDAAVLSAGSRVTLTDAEGEIRRYVEANLSGAGSDARIMRLDVAQDDTAGTITVDAVAEVDATFIRLFGFDHVATEASAVVMRENGGLELAMVLDITASMGAADMRALRAAARTLVSILYGDRRTAENLHIAVVPFNTGVNVGTVNRHWIRPSEFLSSRARSWNGCVRARPGDMDLGVQPPVEGRYSMFDDRRYAAFFELPVSHAPCSDSAILPLTADRAEIERSIDALHSNGFTHINWGAVWGWRVLSPEWRGLWREADSSRLPADYGRSPKKVIVLMTDGDNRFGSDRSSIAYPVVGGSYENRLNNPHNDAEAVAEMDRRLGVVCENAKTAGVQIYTIAFGREIASRRDGSRIQTILEACASRADYFFIAPGEPELQAAFTLIGDSLSELRLAR